MQQVKQNTQNNTWQKNKSRTIRKKIGTELAIGNFLAKNEKAAGKRREKNIVWKRSIIMYGTV